MADFGTFDLGRAYAQATAVQGAQQENQIRGMQIAELKKPKKLTFDELMSNQQIAHAAFTGVAQNPSSAPYWTDVLKKAGVVAPEFDVSTIPPDQLQTLAKQAAQDAGSVLAALDPKQYGEKEKELPEWAKDAVTLGIDPRDTAKMGEFRQQWLADKEAGANERARLAAETSTANAQLSANTSRANAQLSAATAMRGQDISDANADAKLAADAAQLAAPKPTEGNYAAANYAGRMGEAEKKLTEAVYTPNAKEFILASKVMSGGATVAAVANANLSKEAKQYYYAAADWVRAKLRKESGASIPPDEMQQEIRTYFPMPNDGPDIIAQKAQARAQALAGVTQMAGSVKPAIAEPVAPAAGAPVKITDDAGYAALPPGTTYIAPDGSTRTKK